MPLRFVLTGVLILFACASAIANGEGPWSSLDALERLRMAQAIIENRQFEGQDKQWLAAKLGKPASSSNNFVYYLIDKENNIELPAGSTIALLLCSLSADDQITACYIQYD